MFSITSLKNFAMESIQTVKKYLPEQSEPNILKKVSTGLLSSIQRQEVAVSPQARFIGKQVVRCLFPNYYGIYSAVTSVQKNTDFEKIDISNAKNFLISIPIAVKIPALKLRITSFEEIKQNPRDVVKGVAMAIRGISTVRGMMTREPGFTQLGGVKQVVQSAFINALWDKVIKNNSAI